jgi:hypothetical protein
MDLLDTVMFKRMFRVDRETFGELMESTASFMKDRNAMKAANSSGSPITLKARLAVTLRWLAGASYLDLCFSFGIAPSTFYHPNGMLWPTLAAIDAVFTFRLPFDDINKLESLSNGIYEHSSGILDGCIMALDGFGVTTHQPHAWEVERPKDYRLHKGGFTVIVLAGCNINAQFIAASCDHSGSTNNIIAWQDTKLYKLLEVDRALPSKYFFIGDEAFTNTFQFLSPWSGRGLDA